MPSAENSPLYLGIRILSSHIKKKRVSTTYILSGGNPQERERLALDFCRALNCLSGRIFESCDCLSCRKASAEQHPDMVWIGKDLEARSLKILDARQVISNASFKPYESSSKIFIFCGADRLTPEASNALLKLLEEPPPHNVFLLLVDNKMHLLETIQSRAFDIRLGGSTSSRLGELMEIQELMTQPWPARLEKLQALGREEAMSMMESFAAHQLQQIRLQPGSGPGVQLVEKFLETKDALESNVNVKLAMTRLMTHWQNL